MQDLKTVLDSVKQICEALRDPIPEGAAVDCTRTFTILPVRYAAVGGSVAQRLQLPTLPQHLHHPQQVATLQHASYAIRPLREGFLYVMEKRKLSGRYSLHPPYRIAPNGSLSLFSPEHSEPSASPTDTLQDVIRNMAWAFNVHDLDDLLELRLFYSPDPLTEAAQKRLLHLRDNLPAVDVAPFASPLCPAPKPYVIRHDQLDLVADFAAESDLDLRKLLDAQVFNAPSISSLTAARFALGPKPGTPKPRGVAVVVEDALGITQELNAWRNAGLEHLKRWLEKAETVADKPGPSNERKVLVARAFTELHQQFSERRVAALVDRHKDAMRAYLAGSDQAAPPPVADWWAQTQEGILEAAGELKRRDLQTRAQNGEFIRAFEKRYLSRVNVSAMRDQLGEFESHSLEAQRLAQSRTADHLHWLQSSALMGALAFYDENDLSSGLCFAHQTGLCVIGLEGVPEGARLLDQWWREEALSAENLALRSLLFNQYAIGKAYQHAQQALAAPPEDDDWQPLDSALKHVKELAAEFSRVDAHLDQLALHRPINTAGALAWVGQLGRQTVKASAPGAVDRLLYRRLGAYLVASLGTQAVELRMSEHALESPGVSRGRVEAPIVRRLDKAYVDTLRGAHSNQFYQLRVASGLLLLEAGLLLLQGRRDDKDRRFWSEVMAAALTSAAAGTELLAVGTEQTLRGVEPRSVTARGAQVSLGRYRLWGAGLAAAGGVVSSAWDVSDAIDAKDRSKPALAGTYLLRGVATSALLVGQGGIAFSQASALFNYWAIKATRESSILAFNSLAKLSTGLAANRAAMLLLSRMSWIGGAIVLGSSMALLIVDEDLLEKWCSKCCFRLQQSDKGYAEDAEEIGDLFNAMSEVI